MLLLERRRTSAVRGRMVFHRKSALVIVDAVTHQAIDFAVGNGYRMQGHATGKPWTNQWRQQDGMRVRYRILASGFELLSHPDQAANDN